MSDLTERLHDLANKRIPNTLGDLWNGCEEAADALAAAQKRVEELEQQMRLADAASEANKITWDALKAGRDELRELISDMKPHVRLAPDCPMWERIAEAMKGKE